MNPTNTPTDHPAPTINIRAILDEGRSRGNILVIAPPRSGTGYAAKALGLSHELIFSLASCRHHSKKWVLPKTMLRPKGYVREASWLAAPFASQLPRDNWLVIHLTRPPLDAIDSIVRRGFLRFPSNPYTDYAYRFMEHYDFRLPFFNQTRLAARLWAFWTNVCMDAKPDYTITTAQLTQAVAELLPDTAHQLTNYNGGGYNDNPPPDYLPIRAMEDIPSVTAREEVKAVLRRLDHLRAQEAEAAKHVTLPGQPGQPT